MVVLIILIGIVGLFIFVCFLDGVQEKSILKQLDERDNRIWGCLCKKYAKVPNNEIHWLYGELDWVCKSLFDDVQRRNKEDEINQLILSGNYREMYPVQQAKAKLQFINNRYGWVGQDAVQFSTETSESSVYENRYFLATVLNKNSAPCCSFHFYKDKI